MFSYLTLFLVLATSCVHNTVDNPSNSVEIINTDKTNIHSPQSIQDDGCNEEKWSAQNYPEKGTSVQHEGKLYRNKWYANAGNIPGDEGNSPWELIGFCDGSGFDCSNATEWSNEKIYDKKNIEVLHEGDLYKNKWFTKGDKPNTSDVWKYIGPCDMTSVSETEKSSSTDDNSQVPPLPNAAGSAYPYGSLPTTLNEIELNNSYSSWKNKYVTSKGAPTGAKRVLFDDMKHTVSEGIGYGMLITVSMKDQETFDGLFKYYNSYLDKNGLMDWKIDENGKVVGSNAATDADVDVAYALLLAHKHFGDGTYLTDAKKVIGLIKKHMLEPGTFVLKPGDVWGGSNTTNPSYFAPGYFKVFAEVTGDNDWNKAADKCYDILFKCWNPSTGLVPDWCKADGSTPADDVSWSKNGGKSYYYDAARTPWRIAKDYLWYGDARAYKYCNTINDWVSNQGITNTVDGYNLNGSKIGQWRSSTFVGPFACSFLVEKDEQQLINKGYHTNVTQKNNNYFNDTVRLLALVLQHGIFPKY